jgi:hypothetical protein
MEQAKYRSLYVDYLTTFGAAVNRELNNRFGSSKNSLIENNLLQHSRAIQILVILAFIEGGGHVGSEKNWSALRKFKELPDPVPKPIQPHYLKNLSCFIYIRDCFAHRGDCVMFPQTQQNSQSFIAAVTGSEFMYARIEPNLNRFFIEDRAVHDLHQIALHLI